MQSRTDLTERARLSLYHICIKSRKRSRLSLRCICVYWRLFAVEFSYVLGKGCSRVLDLVTAVAQIHAQEWRNDWHRTGKRNSKQKFWGGRHAGRGGAFCSGLRSCMRGRVAADEPSDGNERFFCVRIHVTGNQLSHEFLRPFAGSIYYRNRLYLL